MTPSRRKALAARNALATAAAEPEPAVVWTVHRRGTAGRTQHKDEAKAREAAAMGCCLGYIVELRRHVLGTPCLYCEVLIPAANPEGV